MMNKLALTLPGSVDGGNRASFVVPGPEKLKPEFHDLGSILTQFYAVIFYIAGFLMIFWLAWGIFQYIFAGGNKDALAKARSRITWAIVGFLIVTVAFSISTYIKNIYPQVNKFEENHSPTQVQPYFGP